MLYEIPEERVLHIHGRASKREHLIYGHNAYPQGRARNNDEEQVSLELSKYEKNPYKHILKHQELDEILGTIKYVHIYGFSFSEVDEDYIDWVLKQVCHRSQWEISWFSDIDRDRMDKFVLEHWDLKNRLRMIKLEELSI